MGEGKTTMGQGAVSWHLVLDAFSLSVPPSAALLPGSSSYQFLRPIPLPAPILCPPACLLPACRLPAASPGASRSTAGLGGYKGAIEFRAPGLGCIKALVSMRGSRGRPQAHSGRVLGVVQRGQTRNSGSTILLANDATHLVPSVGSYPHHSSKSHRMCPRPPLRGGPGPEVTVTPVPYPTDSETVSSRAAAILRGGGDAQGAAAPQHRPLLRLLEVGAEGPGLHRAGHRTHDLWHAQDVSSAPAGGSWEDWWWEVATASGGARPPQTTRRSQTGLTFSHPRLLSVWRPAVPPKESSTMLPLSSPS